MTDIFQNKPLERTLKGEFSNVNVHTSTYMYNVFGFNLVVKYYVSVQLIW